MTVTRFAPAPSGRLHVGNIRTALHNLLWAKKTGGRFLLRLDDTDLARSTEAYAAAIDDDLAWLGIHPEARVRQSDRFALYQTSFERLVEAGRIYPAFETPEELDIRRKVLASRGLPPIYERTALDLTDSDRARFDAEGRRPHWRFRLDHHAAIGWDDLIRGPQHFDPAALSDPVIRRADGSWLYLLPSVIDDIDLGITHVVRGEDHVANTAIQTQMFAALDATPPAFAHEALLTGAEGKLSKRLGSLGVEALRESGIEPIALLALLARIGTSDPVEPVADIAPLIDGFDFAHFGRAPARFDEAELALVNARTLHLLPFEAVADRLPAGIDVPGWAAIRPNLERLSDAADLWSIVTGPITPPAMESDARAVIAAALATAETADWAADPWHALTAAAKTTTGAKGRALFLPLRLALTGRDHGPDMAALLPLIGKDETVTRLRAAA